MATDTPPPGADGVVKKASWGMRILGVVAVLVLAFAVAVMVGVMLALLDDPLCKDVEQTIFGPREDCFDLSSVQKTISLILGWSASALGGIATLLGLVFVTTGRHGAQFVRFAAGALVLGGLVFVVDRI